MKKTALHNFIRNNVRGISAKNKINFFRQMSILTRAGITLLASLKILYRSSRGSIKQMIADTIELIEQGSNFSEISLYYVKFFDITMTSMIKAGEETGNLPIVMQQIYENLKRKQEIKKKVIGAMIMPTMTFFMAVGVIFFLSMFVIPKFSSFLSSMGAKLPPITLFVLEVSGYILKNWKMLLTNSAISLVVFFILYHFFPVFRNIIHHIFIKMPLVGSILIYTSIANFANSMSKLISSGVPLVDSLEIAKQGLWLLPLKSTVAKSSKIVLSGGDVSMAYLDDRILPPTVGDLIKAGEESGTLDSTFEQIAIIGNEEADYKIGILQAAIQPIMTVLVGGIVGVVAASLILGMVSLWART